MKRRGQVKEPELKEYCYEVLQRTASGWISLGFFLNKKNAEIYLKEFNTKVVINPIKIQRITLLDNLYKKTKTLSVKPVNKKHEK